MVDPTLAPPSGRRRSSWEAAVAALLLALPGAASAQLDALDSALVHAGNPHLRPELPIVTRAAGLEFRAAELQGYTPTSRTSSPHEEWLGAVASLRRVVFEHRTGRHDGTSRWRRWTHLDSTQIVADFTVVAASTSADPPASSDRARLARRIPHILLAELNRHRGGVRGARDTVIDGVATTRMTATLPGDSTPTHIDLSRPGWRVTRVAHPIDFPGLGRTEIVYRYDDYAPHPALGAVPRRHRMLVGGTRLREMRYATYDTSTSLLDSLARLPDQVNELIDASRAPRRIAPGLFLVVGLGGYTVIFQEFSDHVVALEAPAAAPFSDRFPVRPAVDAEALSRQYIELVRAAVPGKPIRYVVPSHFHSDHAGGAAAFLRIGATILAPVGDTAFYRALAARAGVPDSLTRIEPIGAVRRLTDGTATLELHTAPRNPHTADATIAWWPAQRIVYQGDLFYYNGGTALTPGRGASHRFFADWLARRGLRPARVYGTHSRTHGTPRELALLPGGRER